RAATTTRTSGFSLAPPLIKKICASVAVIGVGSSDAGRVNRLIARLVRRHIQSPSPESVTRLAPSPSRLGGDVLSRLDTTGMLNPWPLCSDRFRIQHRSKLTCSANRRHTTWLSTSAADFGTLLV